MTVKELVEQLKEAPQEASVEIFDYTVSGQAGARAPLGWRPIERADCRPAEGRVELWLSRGMR